MEVTNVPVSVPVPVPVPVPVAQIIQTNIEEFYKCMNNDRASLYKYFAPKFRFSVNSKHYVNIDGLDTVLHMLWRFMFTWLRYETLHMSSKVCVAMVYGKANYPNHTNPFKQRLRFKLVAGSWLIDDTYLVVGSFLEEPIPPLTRPKIANRLKHRV